MEIWITIGILVVIGIITLTFTLRSSSKSTIKYTDSPVEASQSEQIYNSNNDITKLGTLKSQGAITSEEYERMVAALSANHTPPPAVIPQSSGFPKSLYLLPVLFGFLGGIMGALIVAKIYKTKWWQMIVVGIVCSVIAYVIYAAIIPVN